MSNPKTVSDFAEYLIVEKGKGLKLNAKQMVGILNAELEFINKTKGEKE